MSDQARAIRDKLCIVAECTFDRGCGCIEAIDGALSVKDAEIERLRGWVLKMRNKDGSLMYQQVARDSVEVPEQTIQRLERGLRSIHDYLVAGRYGDALFDCEALLCGSKHEPKP